MFAGFLLHLLFHGFISFFLGPLQVSSSFLIRKIVVTIITVTKTYIVLPLKTLGGVAIEEVVLSFDNNALVEHEARSGTTIVFIIVIVDRKLHPDMFSHHLTPVLLNG